MDFKDFVLEVFWGQNIYLVALSVIGFVLLYLSFFKKQLWGVLDPLFYVVVMMGGAAFCVWFMYINKLVEPKYAYSFLGTELALIIGAVFSYSFFSSKVNVVFSDRQYRVADKKLVNICLYTISLFFIIIQFISFLLIGIILFQEDINHVSAFGGHGYIRALLAGAQSVFIIIFFYKYIIYKLSFFDKLLFIFYFISIMLGGSKSAILQPLMYFFILNYYLYKRGVIKKINVNIKWILLIILFPLVTIMYKTDVGIDQALILFGARILASGDVFVMGYDDSVINSFPPNSFFNYIFYPGFGSILKNLGFPVSPPIVLGPQIYEYYYGITTGGPNTRHNYLGLVFLGPYLSVLFSFMCGFLIGSVRGKFISKNRNFFNLMLYVLLYYWIVNLIVDINIFMNSFIWAAIVFIFMYLISNALYSFFYKSKN